jgi:hypothetical protein
LPKNLIKENLLVKVEFEMIAKKVRVSPFGLPEPKRLNKKEIKQDLTLKKIRVS